MNVIIKAILSSVLIMMALLSFTDILAGESDGIEALESDNNRVQLITYIKEMQSQDSKELYASHDSFLENCVEVISNTLPFQSDYKQCEVKVKEVYNEFAKL